MADVRKEGSMTVEGKPREASGEHDGGFVVMQELFQKDGGFGVNLVAVDFAGKCPSREDLQKRAVEDTGCENVRIGAAVKMTICFEEIRHNCHAVKQTQGGV